MNHVLKVGLILVAFIGSGVLFYWTMSGDREVIAHLASRVDLGDSGQVVAGKASELRKISHAGTREWSIFRSGLISEWVLYIHYTNGIVDFVGIVDADRKVRPKDAPSWKESESFRFEEAIQRGISFKE